MVPEMMVPEHHHLVLGLCLSLLRMKCCSEMMMMLMTISARD